MEDYRNNFDVKQTKLLKLLKNVNLVFLPNYRIDKLLFNVSGEALRTNRIKSYVKLIRLLLFDCVFIEYTQRKEELPLLITYNYHRSDHTTSWIQFKEIIKDYNELKINVKKAKLSRIRTVKSFFRATKYYQEFSRQLNVINERVTIRFLSAYLVELKMLEDKIGLFDIGSKAAFIFFDGNHIENLTVQYLRNKGIIVTTMQHGQPVFHGLNCDRLNQTMLLNFSSDYVIVPGEFSKKQFMLAGIPEDKIHVCGSLRSIQPMQKVVHRKFVVLLDCPTYEAAIKSNNNLIEAADKVSSKYKYSYIVKCHPQDDPVKYEGVVGKRGEVMKKSAGINDALNGVDFALLHVSGAYLDALAAGVKSFCLMDDSAFPLVEEAKDMFFDICDLEKKIDWWIGCNFQRKREYFNRIVEYYLSPHDAANRNREFIEGLLLNEQ